MDLKHGSFLLFVVIGTYLAWPGHIEVFISKRGIPGCICASDRASDASTNLYEYVLLLVRFSILSHVFLVSESVIGVCLFLFYLRSRKVDPVPHFITGIDVHNFEYLCFPLLFC